MRSSSVAGGGFSGKSWHAASVILPRRSCFPSGSPAARNQRLRAIACGSGGPTRRWDRSQTRLPFTSSSRSCRTEVWGLRAFTTRTAELERSFAGAPLSENSRAISWQVCAFVLRRRYRRCQARKKSVLFSSSVGRLGSWGSATAPSSDRGCLQ